MNWRKWTYLASLLFILFACQPKTATTNTSVAAATTPPEKSKRTLTKLWETDTLLKTVESLLYDPKTDAIYTANINGHFMAKDGNGSIGKVGLDGQIIDANWVTGMDAPTGLCLRNGLLYTTDIDKVLVIDLSSRKIIKTYNLEGAKALNDITIDDAGTLYVSDTGGDQIFMVKNDKVDILQSNIKTPNGLLVDDNRLLIAQWTPQTLNSFDLVTQRTDSIADKIPQTDGIDLIPQKGYLVATWGGQVHFVSLSGEKTKLLDTRSEGINAADVIFQSSTNRVFVANFDEHRITAYQLSTK
ncbi:MAG: ATP/GTP-binding protein [Bacteroidota bacterium]